MECSYHGKVHSDPIMFDHSFCIQHGYCSNPARCPLVKYCPVQKSYKDIAKTKPLIVLDREREVCSEALNQMELNIKIEHDPNMILHYQTLLIFLRNLKTELDF